MNEAGNRDEKAGGAQKQYIEPTWGVTVRIWWTYYWRSTGLGLSIGFILGAIGDLVARSLGVPPGRVGVIILCLVYNLIGLWVMKMVLGIKYRRYRIALVPRKEH